IVVQDNVVPKPQVLELRRSPLLELDQLLDGARAFQLRHFCLEANHFLQKSSPPQSNRERRGQNAKKNNNNHFAVLPPHSPAFRHPPAAFQSAAAQSLPASAQ